MKFLGFTVLRTRRYLEMCGKIAKFVIKTLYNNRLLRMEIKGKVILNLGLQSGTSKAGNAWSKASIVIETEGQYPKKVMLDNLRNAEAFGKLTVGSVGTFQIEVSSNEFNGRWYTSVNCYKWEIENPYPRPTQQQGVPQQSSATPTLDAMGVKGFQQSYAPPLGNDDLPF